MAFESGVVEICHFFPLYRGKGERAECKDYSGISLVSVVGKIYRYAGILVDRVHKVTEGLIDDEQGGFRAGCVDQIFTLKQIGEKH